MTFSFQAVFPPQSPIRTALFYATKSMWCFFCLPSPPQPMYCCFLWGVFCNKRHFQLQAHLSISGLLSCSLTHRITICAQFVSTIMMPMINKVCWGIGIPPTMLLEPTSSHSSPACVYHAYESFMTGTSSLNGNYLDWSCMGRRGGNTFPHTWGPIQIILPYLQILCQENSHKLCP